MRQAALKEKAIDDLAELRQLIKDLPYKAEPDLAESSVAWFMKEKGMSRSKAIAAAILELKNSKVAFM